ncbi:MAG: glycosyltransferase [gamma proteobacterium endosymbiont of Lamellibrachia anaximandri]|nr:glycosyltransferase [gamma proteobacterium endosymbiont of Lamellibrachia anaximandri]MBL3532332.1 glycosyltransferase [gamma proteobacterium endosymbiont of Lamellibrachia anaximandri]
MSPLDTIAAIFFWLFLFLLIYVYAGYGWLLGALAAILSEKKHKKSLDDEVTLPFITLPLTVYNEESKIAARLDDLLAQDYPSDRLQILIASDGSDDGTEPIIQAYAEKHACIRLIQSGGRLGKSGTQNLAIGTIAHGIVVLTDADTRFEVDYLRHIGEAFLIPEVGCVTANLQFKDVGGGVSQSQGYYWSYELKLRKLESRLGLLAVCSGQAMAFRKDYFVELPLNVGDDCIIPLDTVLQNAKIKHVEKAIAYDIMEHESRREFHTRVRMTLRNWVGTWLRPNLLNPFRHPGYAFTLWSHKLLRWLGGPALFALLILSLWLGLRIDAYLPAAIVALLFCLAGMIGWRLEGREHNIPVVGAVFSFFLANTGFSIGLWKALRGQQIVVYQSGVSSPHKFPNPSTQKKG